MDCKRIKRTGATSLLCSVEQVVKDGIELSELRSVQSKLKNLTELVDKEVKSQEYGEEKRGLNYKGSGAEKCKCGNTFDPDGDYCGVCEECGLSNMCIECLHECKCESIRFCGDCHSKRTCKVCEMSVLCGEDCDGATKCEHCHEIVCEECTREVHLHCGPRGGFDKTMCENCVVHG